MSELTPERWLYGKLSGDATLTALIGGAVSPRLYSDLAPAGAVYPMVVFAALSGVPVAGVGPAIIMWNEIYAVKTIGQGAPLTSLETIADRIRTVLQAASGSVTGGVVVACTAQGRARLTDVIEGVAYRQLIQTFRIYSQ